MICFYAKSRTRKPPLGISQFFVCLTAGEWFFVFFANTYTDGLVSAIGIPAYLNK